MRNSKNKPFNIPNGFFEKQRTEILDATSEKHHIHKGHVIKRKLVVRS